MNQIKILSILIISVFFVNYINYFQKDVDKLQKKVVLIQNKILKEQRLNKSDFNITTLKIDKFDYFFDKNRNYSQSMGRIQEIVNSTAKDICEVKHIKWSQIPTSTTWYQHLKFNISLECTPNNMLLFSNNLRKSNKLILLKNMILMKLKRKNVLQMNATLIAFKVNNE